MDFEFFHTGHPGLNSMVSPGTPPAGYVFRMFREYQNNAVIVAHYNFTGKLKGQKYREGLRPEAIVFLIICLLIVLENAIILVAIWRNKKFHLPMYYLLGNLTLSDLLAGFTYMVNIVLSGAKTLQLTPVLWFIREGGVFITLAASVISLLAIAIERHVTMVRMKPYQGAKRNRMFILIGASWLLSVLLGVLPIMGWNCICNLESCSTVLPLYSKSYILFCISVFSTVLLSIVALYARIFHVVRANAQRLGCLRPSQARRSRKCVALLKTVTIVLGVFIACWLPLFTFLLLDVCCGVQACGVLYKADYFLGIAMLNSLLNPIIYTLTSRDIRKAIVLLLCRHCLVTNDGRVRSIGLPFLECSTSRMEMTSHRLEGLETMVSTGNITASHVKELCSKVLKT